MIDTTWLRVGFNRFARAVMPDKLHSLKTGLRRSAAPVGVIVLVLLVAGSAPLPEPTLNPTN